MQTFLWEKTMGWNVEITVLFWLWMAEYIYKLTSAVISAGFSISHFPSPRGKAHFLLCPCTVLPSWSEVLLGFVEATHVCVLFFNICKCIYSSQWPLVVNTILVPILQTIIDPKAHWRKTWAHVARGEQLANLGEEYTAILCITLATFLYVQLISK